MKVLLPRDKLDAAIEAVMIAHRVAEDETGRKIAPQTADPIAIEAAILRCLDAQHPNWDVRPKSPIQIAGALFTGGPA